MYRKLAVGLILILGLTALYAYTIRQPQIEANYTYQIINKYPHDSEAFTQGLAYHEDLFIEGTGLRGRSSIRKVEPTSGQIIEKVDLDPEYFGEGVAVHGEHIYQITWQENQGYVYTLDLVRINNFTYSGEGWGLTSDGDYLVMSNGTSTLSYIAPETLTIISTIKVTYMGKAVSQINELEYIEDHIYANIWQTDQIAIIKPETGEVISWIDLTGLEENLDSKADINVLNGIAYDQENKRIFVTGKLWPNIFEIKLIPTPTS